MKIIPVRAFSDNYIWCLLDTVTRQMVCVDPGDAEPVLQILKETNYQLTTILLTHHHPDHIGGIDKLVDHYPNLAVYAPEDARIPYITHAANSGKPIHLPHGSFTVLETPGHTTTHICYYEPNHELLFCGDTLFSAGCGRVFDGTIEQLHQSLNQLRQLPGRTRVYCGHEYTYQNLLFAKTVEPENAEIQSYCTRLQAGPEHQCSLPSTIELELQINPFFRTEHNQVKQFAAQNGASALDSLAVFSVLREQKNNFSA